MRNPDGQPEVTVQQFSHLEDVLGSHGRSAQQLEIWEATYGPIGEDGYPKPLWDKQTGKIDHSVALYIELISREEIHVAEATSDSPAMSIGKTTPEFLNACCRLLDLLESPKDIPFLGGLIQREIIYRVLRGRVGARLRAIATLGDRSHRTAKAVAWIAANYAKPLRVEELAQLASMGVSTLHHHFRVLTSMSPLQYQKQLRLQSARSLMLNNGLDAASAAFEVGYESATQFNREYSRFFGQPPMRDIRALLSPEAPKLQLVGNL